MNILILGSGGREHAFAWKMAQSQIVGKLYIAPGNSGTALLGENLDINILNFNEVKKAVLQKSINLVVVGPEEPLVNGIYDYFVNDPELENVKLIGPSQKAAMLEGSKDFAKEFMQKYNIPTAKFKTIIKQNLVEGKQFLETLKSPYVLKADGLAAGKGVLIINNLEQAQQSLETMLNGQFGKASEKVVIEEYLQGIEVSFFVLTDGNNYKILPEAKDYKRVGDGDEGLNTGGMGAVSPVHFVNQEFKNKVETQIIIPTIKGLLNEKIVYKGFIFIGLMNVAGNPYVIEYNVRMGDPETEVVMPRIKSDLVELLQAVANGNLNEIILETNNQTVTTVVLVSGGYPEDYEKGKEIFNLERIKDSIVFHSGTKLENNKILTNGGRVLTISSLGNSIEEAVAKSNEAANIIKFEKKYYRTDIGKDLISIL